MQKEMVSAVEGAPELSRTFDVQADLQYVYLLAGIWMLFSFGWTIVDPILPLRIASVGASEVELGSIVSLLSLTSLLSRVPLTVLARRVGVSEVILLSVVGRLMALALYAFAPSPAWFYPARVLDAIGGALVLPVLMTEVSRCSLTASMGDSMGRFLTSYGLASVLGPVICSVLLGYLTYSQVIVTASSFLLLILLLLNRVRRHSSIDQRNRQKNQETFRALKRTMQSPNLTILVFVGIVFSIGTGFVSTFFAIYVVNDLGLSPSMVALAFALQGLANLLSRFPSGMLCDRIGERKPLIVAFATLAVAFFFMAKSPSVFMVVLSMGLIGLGWGIYSVASWTILSESVEEQDRKIAAAYHTSAFDGGSAIGAVSSGFLAAAFSTSDIFLVGSGLMLGVLVTVLLSRNWPLSID